MKKNCQNFQENISALIDNQLNSKEKSETLEHLDSCVQCHKLYNRMNKLQETIQSGITQLEVPWYGVDPLINRLHQKKHGIVYGIRGKIDSLFSKKWAYAIEFAILFCMAIYAGIRLYPVLYRENRSISGTDVRPIAFDYALQNNIDDFLEKSTTVLLQIKNGEPDVPYDQEQKIAEELFLQTKLVSRSLQTDDYRHVSALINELEPVFLDIAHLDQPSFRLLQKTIGDKNLLLKLQFAKSREFPIILK